MIGQEVASDANPAITPYNMPTPTTVSNGYDYNGAVQRRAEGINLIGQGANDYSKQLADRRVEAQGAKLQADASAKVAAANTAARAAALAASKQNNVGSAAKVNQSNFAPGITNQMSIIDKMFPGVKMTSGYRPGGTSWHSKGRAVDLPPTMAIYNWIKANYPNSKELIFGPGGNNQIKDGKIVPASYYGASTMAGHYNHIHWAY